MVACPACGKELPGEFPFCPFCGAPLSTPAAQEMRKTVTVVFCDVSGSTELGDRLDPESLRRVMARYFEVMRTVIERHGGTVEKFIGDAVMAVFGVPVLHEDDALRAVRAASEMLEALAGLNGDLTHDHGVALELRIGVNTGEVVAGTEERLVTGDAVNLAARLEQAAAPGEILIGEATFGLVRDAVEVDDVASLAVKGKEDPVSAYRLRSVGGARHGHTRRLDARLVGRKRELRMLASAWERVSVERGCHLFTLLGPPGVGKSRLVQEFLEQLDGARVLQGRCLSYGEGITYWPVVEFVLQLLGDDPDTTMARLGIDELVAGQVATLLRRQDAPTTSEETAWAVRKLLEAAALTVPLVLVLDDINWGEPAFLDLVEHIADLSRDAPILLLCMARPEVLERRPGWGGGKLNATTVLLESLSTGETDELIENLLGEHLLDEAQRARIREAAEGNPLFVEEMLAMLRESNGSQRKVPPTIQALLAARLDLLDLPERRVLECAAVEGQVFHLGAVQALDADESQLRARLTGLVRKELIRPDRPQLAGEDAFRFRHLLIRDAAYEALPKATRADLHERLAGWMEGRGPDPVEADEIIGYHLEQAHRYHAELGPPGDAERELASRAAERLFTAGNHADERGDFAASLNLLGRTLALTPEDEPAIALRLEVAEARFRAGDFAGAEQAAIEAVERAADAGDHPGELRARLAALMMTSDNEGITDALRELVVEALPVFEKLDDDAGLVQTWQAIGLIAGYGQRYGEQLAATERALVYARRLGDRRKEISLLGAVVHGMSDGMAPVEEVLHWLDEHQWLEQPRPWLLAVRAQCLARLGRFDEARAALLAERSRYEEVGAKFLAAGTGMTAWELEMLAGDAAAAEREARCGCEQLEELGERGVLSTLACQLALSLCDLGRHDEAEASARRGAELGATDDLITHIYWHRVMARVLAHRDQLTEAERSAGEAVQMADRTDMPITQADTRLDLATVLQQAGRTTEAADCMRQALALYEQKGDFVSSARARELLGDLTAEV